MKISLSGLEQNNPIDCLKLAYFLNKDKVYEAFAKVKIQVENEKDLEMLSKIIANKIDVEGKLRDPNDESRPLMFDSMAIIHNIEWSEEEKSKAENFDNYTK